MTDQEILDGWNAGQCAYEMAKGRSGVSAVGVARRLKALKKMKRAMRFMTKERMK